MVNQASRGRSRETSATENGLRALVLRRRLPHAVRGGASLTPFAPPAAPLQMAAQLPYSGGQKRCPR